MNKDQIEQLVIAAGALAEACSVFYDSCLNQGFEEYQALKLTASFLEGVLGGARK